MEAKKDWNLRVYASIADAFDALSESRYRGQKGTCCSAACLMFVLASDESRNAVIDLLKLAEGRGYDGSILDAVRKQLENDPLAEVVDGLVARHGKPNRTQPGRATGRQRKASGE